MSRDEQTYAQVSRKFDDWTEAEARRPKRDRLRRTDPAPLTDPRENSDMSRIVFAAIGIGIGVVLLGLAAYAFIAAAYWADFGRDGAQVGYTLVGVFLLIAGFGGIAATWNHNFRVLTRPPQHH